MTRSGPTSRACGAPCSDDLTASLVEGGHRWPLPAVQLVEGKHCFAAVRDHKLEYRQAQGWTHASADPASDLHLLTARAPHTRHMQLSAVLTRAAQACWCHAASEAQEHNHVSCQLVLRTVQPADAQGQKMPNREVRHTCPPCPSSARPHHSLTSCWQTRRLCRCSCAGWGSAP